MKLKTIYQNEILAIVFNLCLALGALFIAVALNDDYNQINFLYFLYLLFGIAIFALGYLEMANLTVLGMGVTRFSIFKKFNLTILIMLISLLALSFYYDLLIVLSEKELQRVNISLIIFLSFVILFLGQVGMLFANLRVDKYIGAFFCFIIISGTIFEIRSIITIKFINIILGALSIILIFINYGLIKNIKLQNYF